MYMCHNSSACHTYVMWAELGHGHFSSGKRNEGAIAHQHLERSNHWKHYTCFKKEVCTRIQSSDNGIATTVAKSKTNLLERSPP